MRGRLFDEEGDLVCDVSDISITGAVTRTGTAFLARCPISARVPDRGMLRTEGGHHYKVRVQRRTIFVDAEGTVQRLLGLVIAPESN